MVYELEFDEYKLSKTQNELARLKKSLREHATILKEQLSNAHIKNLVADEMGLYENLIEDYTRLIYVCEELDYIEKSMEKTKINFNYYEKKIADIIENI